MPQMPPGVIDMVSANPEGFADAMGTGMEAMTAAIADGASPADAFSTMGDIMGPIMEDLGMSPEVFDAMGDMVGAAVGPAMHMAPADADGGDMGAIMQDGIDMMMPPGMEVPGPIMDAMGDMGQAMGDAGMGCHDVAAEFMAPPGDPMYPMPMDGAGNPVVEPGDPATCPIEACQPPPMDGACATAAPDMMPPEGGYDHAPMAPDFVMPDPDALNPEPFDTMMGDGGDDGGLGALGGAFDNPAADMPAPDAMDAALGNAMDGAMDQGGAPAGGVAGSDNPAAGMPDPADPAGEPSDDVDPSAGMG